MYCPHCNQEVKTTVRTLTETYPVKGENITILADVRHCNCCGNEIWDELLDSKNLLNAYAIFRRRHHLLQPEEIRNIRKKYGLSQSAFAKVLGLGEKTITRYENGSIPDAAQNALIKLVRHPENFAFLLQENRATISPQEYSSACTALEVLRSSPSMQYPLPNPQYQIPASPDSI